MKITTTTVEKESQAVIDKFLEEVMRIGVETYLKREIEASLKQEIGTSVDFDWQPDGSLDMSIEFLPFLLNGDTPTSEK